MQVVKEVVGWYVTAGQSTGGVDLHVIKAIYRYMYSRWDDTDRCICGETDGTGDNYMVRWMIVATSVQIAHDHSGLA